MTDQDRELLRSVLIVKPVKRKELLELPGRISRHRSFILTGAMRAFILDGNAQEQTVILAIDGWGIGDFASFLLQKPGTMYVEAITASTLIQWSYDSEQILRREIPAFSTFLLQRTELMAVLLQQRFLSYLTLTAEQRYDQFAIDHPELLQRFPLYLIASYLGMSKEFLSRIRHQKAIPGNLQ